MQFEVVETFSSREGQSCRNIPMCNSQRCSTEASLSQTKAQRMSTIEKEQNRIPFWETLRLSSDWEEQNGKLSLVGWSCRSRSRPSGASDELGSAKLNSANCHLLALPRVQHTLNWCPSKLGQDARCFADKPMLKLNNKSDLGWERENKKRQIQYPLSLSYKYGTNGLRFVG